VLRGWPPARHGAHSTTRPSESLASAAPSLGERGSFVVGEVAQPLLVCHGILLTSASPWSNVTDLGSLP